MCVTHEGSAHGGQKRLLGTPGLELQMAYKSGNVGARN